MDCMTVEVCGMAINTFTFYNSSDPVLAGCSLQERRSCVTSRADPAVDINWIRLGMTVSAHCCVKDMSVSGCTVVNSLMNSWRRPVFMTGEAVDSTAGINHQLDGKASRTADVDVAQSIVTGCTVIEMNLLDLSKVTDQVITVNSEDTPEYLLSAHVALGFWAEGSSEKAKAFEHYEESLGSYLDENVEYEFALARLRRLKTNSE